VQAAEATEVLLIVQTTFLQVEEQTLAAVEVQQTLGGDNTTAVAVLVV
jgi:hypothetical protein